MGDGIVGLDKEDGAKLSTTGIDPFQLALFTRSAVAAGAGAAIAIASVVVVVVAVAVVAVVAVIGD
jgi:hypothetical protein